ncbi:E3 ubiquitin-protein ligase TRIM21-like [Pholidichthys leucotaenia]
MSVATNLQSEDHCLCSICLDVFTDPVTIPCGHNFCKNCITQHWDVNSCQCPMCKKKFNMRPELHINTLISEMVSQFRRESQQKSSSSSSEQQAAKPGEVLCDICTGTKLKALKFCLVCLISYCETHLEPHLTMNCLKKHILMEPAENLEGRMCMKHDKPLELFCKTDQTCVCMLCSYSNHKTHDVVFLREEYEGKKAELGKREAEMQQMIQKRQQKIEEIKELESAERVLKEKLMVAELKRVQQYAVDVTLDPDTAHPDLILSEDGKQVHDSGVRKELPDNPERFSQCVSVLGNQSFSSGKFYFEVQVQGKTDWVLGVARESIDRKGEITATPQDGYWTLWLRKDYEAMENPLVNLHLQCGPEKVGVFVDYEEGLVSFYDVDSAARIYSFTDCSFNHKLLPYFCPCINDGGKNSAPLVITPINHSR